MDEKELLEKVQSEANSAVEKFKTELTAIAKKEAEGKITKEEAEKAAKEVTKTMETEITKLREDLNAMNLQLKNIEDGGISKEIENKFEKDVKEWASSAEFKSWVEGGLKGASPELRLKYTITGGNRTGTVLITNQSSVVSDAFVARKKHVRDLMNVIPTDMPNHTFDRVTEWTPGADMVSENGDAPTFDIKTAEQSVNVKRVAGIMDISNNVMRSIPYLVRKIQSTAPEKLRNVEDFQLLFGDGAGNNVDGIYKQATTFDITGPSFVAGKVASVASYNGGTQCLITFAAVHGLTNAFKITFASATSAGYNATFQVNVKTDKSIVIDKAYVAETDTSAWTATSAHYLKNAIAGAQEYDALMAAKSFMAGSEYTLSGYILNPATATLIESIKGTTLEYVGKIERINGVLYISGTPVVETNAIPAGKFLGGDFFAATELLEYEGLSLRFVEDVSYVKANKQALYITEQIMLPVYNPFMFVKGDFATVIAAIKAA